MGRGRGRDGRDWVGAEGLLGPGWTGADGLYPARGEVSGSGTLCVPRRLS